MSKRKTKIIRRPAPQALADVTAPEKRDANFFARVRASNKKWIESQAKERGLNSSQYFDLLVEKLKSGTSAHA